MALRLTAALPCLFAVAVARTTSAHSLLHARPHTARLSTCAMAFDPKTVTLNTTVTLNSGHKMPVVGLGTYKAKGAEIEDALRYAVETLGLRHIDTAAFYDNEDAIGRALKKLNVPREELFVVTKLWVDSQGYDNARRAFEESRRKLDLDYVDLYLIHHPSSSDLQDSSPQNAVRRAESWRAMEDLVKEGKIRSIGVSNYEIKHLEPLLRNCRIRPAVNQVEYHPLLTREALVAYCAKEGIAFEAYSSLAKNSPKLMANPTVLDMSARIGKSPAQILLRWALQHGAIIIPKSTNKQRMADNVALFNFELSPNDMKQLDALNRNWHCTWTSENVA